MRLVCPNVVLWARSIWLSHRFEFIPYEPFSESLRGQTWKFRGQSRIVHRVFVFKSAWDGLRANGVALMSLRHLLSASTGLLALFVLAGCNTIENKPLTPKSTSVPPKRAQTVVIAPRIAPAVQAKEVKLEVAKTVQKSTPPPMDIWSRMRKGYQLDLAQENSRVERDIRWYAKHSEYLLRVQNRATPYLYFILEEIEKRNMPSEFALLPVVESAFQPFAYSSGRAAGLWQFIPSTGRMYNLKQNWWYDGRRDVVAATRAALDYLAALAKQFDGDWNLALAAYNAGGGTVRKAIKRNIKKGKATDFWNLDLPKETMGYVPRLLAIASIIKAPAEYGLSLKTIENKAYFETIETGSQLDLALAAEMAGISVDELYQLNPGFNRWATAPEGPHWLNIPIPAAEGFKSKLAALPMNKRLLWTRYKIKSGDSLGLIAKKHSTTIALLKSTNKLKSHRIRAGKHLLIPVSAKGSTAYTFSAEQRLAQKQNKKGKGKKTIHHVRAGDTLWELSLRYKINHKKLARWNGIAPGDTLHLGQKLVIWTSTTAVAQNSSTSPVVSPPISPQSSVRYRVRKGDSLARIANKFRVSVADLKKWNPLPGKYLQPGQKIQLYVDVTEQTTTL